MDKLLDSPENTRDKDRESLIDANDDKSIVTFSSSDVAPNESGSVALPAVEPPSSSEPPAGSPVSAEALSRLGHSTLVGGKAHLTDQRWLGSILLLGAIITVSSLGGFLLGQRGPGWGNSDLATLSADASGRANAPDSIQSANGGELRVADAQAIAAQNEITAQLGQMRAELLRLHTVFVHLAELAELDDGEFDLESPLLDWQEQSSLERIGLLNRRIAHISDSSAILNRIFDTRRMAFDQKISGRPIVEGHRTSGFGYRTDPISGKRLEHQGLDFSGPVGEPILALADGVVTFSGKNAGYGNLVELEHVDGLRTRYAHNQANLVKRGATVKKGEAIATLGSTGRSTGPHVHIEVRLDGSPIDPGFFVR